MKRTQRILMALYVGFLLLAALLYVAGDFFEADLSFLSAASRQHRFVSSTVMTLLTIGLLPLSLRLFALSPVRSDLYRRQAPALLRWGGVRLCLIGGLLVVNTALYYAFGYEAAYGYLAVVALLCMPFVFPTRSRCHAEVQPVPGQNDETDEEANRHHSQL